MTTNSNLLSADQLTRPFVESTQAVFSMMLGCQVEMVDECRCSEASSSFEISGIIGFTGAIRGTIVISLNQNLAFSISEILLGTRPVAVDADVRDMVGELANMIGGNAKERLNNAAVSLGLPTVISGEGFEVSVDARAESHKLCFATPWGPLAVEVALQQVL